MTSQSDKILELLRVRGPRGLTALEAMAAGAGMRLAARISDLRAAGHVITSETITTLNGARVARYTLDGHACPLCGGWYTSDWDSHRFVDERHIRAERLIAVTHKVAHEPENLDLWTEGEKREAWGK